MVLLTAHSVEASTTPEPTMTWEAWVTVFTCVAVLLVLSLNLVGCAPAMVVSAVFLYLVGIVSFSDVLAGLSNSSVVTIALLFIIVDPIADLPRVKRAVAVALGDLSSAVGIRWATFKIVLMCLATSSFLNNTPQVAVLTNLIKIYCRECGASPSQLLLPMNYATLCGNYALIGTSTNLIVSGLMEKYGMGSMPFFELVKINGPFTVIMLAYLVFLPQFLLPKNRGGMFRAMRQMGTEFFSRLRVGSTSPVIGHSVASVVKRYGESIMFGLDVLQVQRGDVTFFPITGEEMLKSNDIVMVRGDVTKVREASTMLGLTWEPLSIVTALRESQPTLTEPHPHDGTESHHECSVLLSGVVDSRDNHGTSHAHRESPVAEMNDIMAVPAFPPVPISPSESPHVTTSPLPQPASVSTKTPTSSTTAARLIPHAPSTALGSFASRPPPDGPPTALHERSSSDGLTKYASQQADLADLGEAETLTRSFALGAQFQAPSVSEAHTNFFEVVIGPNCPSVGLTVASGHFQQHYNATVLAVRAINGLDSVDVYAAGLAQHLIHVGDTVLLLARANFREQWHAVGSNYAGDFIAINEIESPNTEESIEAFYVRLPSWTPWIGHIISTAEGKTVKVVHLPAWYPYVSIPIFLTMLGFAIADYDIGVLSLLAAIGTVTLGLMTTSKALAVIEWEVIIMVAFSFALASGMTKSGFADVLGNALKNANVSGIRLLYLISGLASIMTNVITNKACVQVMIPIVVSAYRQQGKDPLPAVMMTTALASAALSTPYGFATNLMVMGPGGYRPLDFIKFGLPLNVLYAVILPIITAVVYGMDW